MRFVYWFIDRVDVAGVVTFLAGAGTLKLLQLFSQGGSRLRLRLRERRRWYERLGRLRADVSRGYFEQELGLAAAFRRQAGDGDYVEHIYPHRWFFVQALTDNQDRVAFYSVTSRNTDFRPAIWPTSTSLRSVPVIPHPALGDFTFEDAFPDHGPDGIAALFNGATATSFYDESYYVGNPGHYLTFLVAMNDAGHYFFDLGEAVSEPLFAAPIHIGRLAGDISDEDVNAFLGRDSVRRFRSMARPNCYGIIGQTLGFGQPLPVFVGPNRTQVRTL